MKSMKRGIGLLALMGVAALLTGCQNCVDSSICPFVRSANYKITATITPGPVTIHPGQTIQADVVITRSGISDSDALILGSDAAVKNNDATLLAEFDNGHVTVRYLGGSFTSNTVQVTISADAQATVSADTYYSVAGERAYIRRVADDFRFPLAGGIQVK